VASFPGFDNEEILNFEDIYTGDGNDKVIGSSLNNVISTGLGNDELYGGNGNDTLLGGAGNDFISGEFGDNYMDGDAGIDAVDYGFWDFDATYNLATGVASFPGFDNEEILNFEIIYTGDGNDSVTGNSVDNLIYTYGGNDTINGGGGNDILLGVDGNDRLLGGNGKDLLYGGPGNETLTGGNGADAFRFLSPNGGVDRITDFNQQQRDNIQVLARYDGFVDGGLTTGVLLDSQFVIGASAADSSDRFIYNSTNGNLFYDSDGIGGAAQVQFAQLNAGLPLAASDFIVT
jgi:serralysin